jgi:hypothetical protein
MEDRTPRRRTYPTAAVSGHRVELAFPYAEALRPYIGQWVATAGDEVLVSGDGPAPVVAWLTRHGQRADSMFRVPDTEAAAGCAATL